jgi:hypothetical protein
MEDIKRTVSVLASLIRIHRQRVDAYSMLWGTTSNDETRSLCKHQIDLSIQILGNLSVWRSAYDSFGTHLSRYTDTNIWFQTRLLFSFNPERTVIRRCQKLERETLKMYELALPLIPSSAVNDLRSQTKALEPMIRKIQQAGERTHFVSSGSLAMK